ncbi:MAG: hypothetical protein JST54_09355 [Deltaproteobacteria bacterium]|nr:hypothetical protein [Deltaproteobacteria bacterium]
MPRRVALLVSLASVLALPFAGCGAGEAQVETPKPDAPASSDLFTGDPAHGAEYALDVSFWEGPISEYEMDCFWSSGVRHMVIGTQLQETTTQQLQMAGARGMTVDAYVYLYWDQDMATQVKNAFQMVRGYPVGRMWLDVEALPGSLGANQLIPLLQQAVDACQAEGDCGIYTGPGWWKSYVNNTTQFSNLPLWYALYNGKTSLGDWSTEKFGGWTAPVGKQFTSVGICGIGGADGDVLQVSAQPQVVVDRTPPPAPTTAPAAPSDLFPTSGMVELLGYTKMMVDTVPSATSYQFDLEYASGGGFASYYTWTASKPFVKVTPTYNNRVYRFRARAQDAYGWGAWSGYSAFGYGAGAPAVSSGGASSSTTGTSGTTSTSTTGSTSGGGSGLTSSTSGSGSTGSTSSTSTGSTGTTTGSTGSSGTTGATGGPTGLAPDGDKTVTTPNVTLSCSPVTGATKYTFAIEYQSGGAWLTYYGYTPSSPSVTFYPQIHAQYRWRVQATVGGVAGPWSAYATFDYP